MLVECLLKKITAFAILFVSDLACSVLILELSILEEYVDEDADRRSIKRRREQETLCRSDISHSQSVFYSRAHV